MASPTSVHFTAWEFLERAERIKTQRFQWVHDFRDRALQDFEESQKEFQEWRSDANAEIYRLRTGGHTYEADWLAAKLLSSNYLQNPGEFKLVIPTGHGTEQIHITGSEYERMPQAASGAATAHTIDEPQVARLLALSAPISLELDVAQVELLEPLDWQQVTEQQLWITTDPSGALFCLSCPCSGMVIASSEPAGPSHKLVPRHFHRDPMERDFALQHFHTVHFEHFPHGVVQMFQKYGRKITPDSLGNAGLINKFTIASHNLSVREWYKEQGRQWMEMTTQIHRPPRANQEQRAVNISKSIEASCVSGSEIFATSSNSMCIILCTNPYCDMAHAPSRSAAVAHFRTHDLDLSETDMLNLFAFQVVGEYVVEGVEQHVEEVEKHSEGVEQHIERRIEPNPSSQIAQGEGDRTPLLRDSTADVIWGTTDRGTVKYLKDMTREKEYQACVRDDLLRECEARYIQLGPVRTKAVAVHRLCVHDLLGLEDLSQADIEAMIRDQGIPSIKQRRDRTRKMEREIMSILDG